MITDGQPPRQRSFGSKKQGFEFVYVAIDAVEWFAKQKVTIERVMTDNGSV